MYNFVVENGDGSLFTGSIFDPNNSKHRAFAERQPSYLRAIGVISQQNAVSDNTKEPLVATYKSHAPIPQVLGSRKQHTTVQEKYASTMMFSSQVSPFSQQAALFDPMPFKESKRSRFQQPVDGFADEKLTTASGLCGKNLSHVRNVNELSYVNCNPDRQGFMKMASDDVQPDISYGLSAVLPLQNVKPIPRAVIAPMSRAEVVGRPYPIDKFSSLPKELKNTHLDKGNPLKNSFDTELSTSTSKSFGANTAYHMVRQQDLDFGLGTSCVCSQPSSTSQHSGIVNECVKRHHPSFYRCRADDVEKPKAVDDIYDGHSYIHPQTVESVLSYQNLARKSSEIHCQRDKIPGVTAGKYAPLVAPNGFNRDLAYTDIRPICWSTNEIVSVPISSEIPLERTCGGDRRSASSSSTACSSHLDSGFCGDCHESASLTSPSQSPELYNLGHISSPFNCCPKPMISVDRSSSADILCQPLNWEPDRCCSTAPFASDATSQAGHSQFNHPEVLQAAQSPLSWNQRHEVFPEGLPLVPVLSEVHSQLHEKTPLARWSQHMQLNSDVDVASSRADYRNNRQLNMMPVNDKNLSGTDITAVKEPTNVKQVMMAGKYAAKPGVENTAEQMKYLSMLERQIKLYRVKDEENLRLENNSGQKFTVQNNAMLSAMGMLDPQADRTIARSSCIDLEMTRDLAFKSTIAEPGSSEICGSMDLKKCKPHQLEMDGNIRKLISKKKAFVQKRVGLGTVESNNHDSRGVSFFGPESTTHHNSAEEYPTPSDFQRMQLGETKRTAQLNSVCRSSEAIGKHGENPRQLACSVKSVADISSANSVLANSAEDIVNTWTLLKNERNAQVRRNDGSLLPITSHNVGNFQISSVSNAPSDAKNFRVSPDRVAPNSDDNRQRNKIGKQVKKNVSFSDNVAWIASTEEVPNKTVDYVEYVTSFLRKRASGLKSFEVTDDRSSQCESSSRGSLLSESWSNSSGSRSNSDVSKSESCGGSGDRDSDFYENDESECSEGDSEGTIVDETGRIRCSLCHKRWIDTSDIYCKDCSFYMAKFQQEAA